MAQPEMQRQVRQQRADIDALYELTEQGFTDLREKVDGLEVKVASLDTKVDQGFEAITRQLAEILRQLRSN